MLSPEQVQMYRKKYGLDTSSGVSLPTKSSGTDLQTRLNQIDEAAKSSTSVTLPKKKGFVERTKDVITDRSEKAGEIADKTYSKKQNFLSGVLQTAGNAAGALGDIGFEAAKTVLPQKVKDVAKKGIEAVASTKPVQSTIEKYNEWAKQHPEAASNLGATFDLGTLLTGSKLLESGTGKLVNATEKVAKKTVDVAKKPIEKIVATKAVEKAKTLTELPGQILQGTKADIPKVKNALLHIDPKNIKTYTDLKNELTEKIKSASRNLDETLGKDTTLRKLDELVISSKVGNQTVTHNFVNDALDQLEDIFKKTNNPTRQAEMAQLKKKAGEQGLTIKEVNDLAKLHGQELNSFNANGQLASGLTKQAAENTRSGLKDTARDLFGDDIYKASDQEISELIKAKDLAEKMDEAVNKLRQKIQSRSLGAKAGYLLGKVINTIGLGSPKGIVEALIPRGQGFKTLNALDLEKMLQKNLEKFQSLSGNIPEKTLIEKLESILKDSKKTTLPKKN